MKKLICAALFIAAASSSSSAYAFNKEKFKTDYTTLLKQVENECRESVMGYFNKNRLRLKSAQEQQLMRAYNIDGFDLNWITGKMVSGSCLAGRNTTTKSDDKNIHLSVDGTNLENNLNNLKKLIADIKAHKSSLDKAKRKAAQIAQAKQASKHEKFDALRNEGRVYATLVMDTSLDYNKVALAKIKKSDDKIADLSLHTKTDDNGLINRIILESPTKNVMGALLGSNEEPWTMDKIQEVATSIKAKYKHIDTTESKQAHKLEDVRNGILRYHNARPQPSQADYEYDASHAEAIVNHTETQTFDNNGDQIIMTIKTNLAGQGNTNAEIHMNDLQQNLLTIEYVSRTLVAQQNTAKQEALQKETEQNAKEKKEMNQL